MAEVLPKQYQPSPKQAERWSGQSIPDPIPSDEQFQAEAKRRRRPWGILKRDWVLRNLRHTKEYQRGLWQGQLDKARGVPYTKDREDAAYNFGYYAGYRDYESNRRGWDPQTRAWFDAQVSDVEVPQ